MSLKMKENEVGNKEENQLSENTKLQIEVERLKQGEVLIETLNIDLKKANENWPRFDLPKSRGNITVSDVVDVPAEGARDEMIKKWCISVWGAYKETQEKVRINTDADLR